MKSTATLFIDESGKSSLAKKTNEPFLISGVILRNSEIQIVEGFFNYIKRKYKISPDLPFHSFDIYENPKTKLSINKAFSLSIALAEFVSLIPIKIKIIITNKQEFRNALGVQSDNDFKGSSKRKEMKDYPYRIMASYLFDWFAKELEKDDFIGQVIGDARRGGDVQLLKTLDLCKEQTIFNIESRKAIKSRITAICFAEKGYLSGGLEITDLISYVAFFAARRVMTTVHQFGIHLIWNKIKKTNHFVSNKVNEEEVRKFFGIKKGEVHKYLK